MLSNRGRRFAAELHRMEPQRIHPSLQITSNVEMDVVEPHKGRNSIITFTVR